MRTHSGLLILLIALSGAQAGEPRSRAARTQFQLMNSCPSTGATRGPCPGYVVDHIIPLCGGGPDLPCNMQWQTIEAAKQKDQIERKFCLLK